MTDLHKAAQQAREALELIFASVLPYDQAGEPTIPDKANAAANTAITALREALAKPAVPELMVDCMPPATRRDQWFYEQGRLAERDLRSYPSIEDLCARIKAADDAAADGDYMLDSNDCISVLRGTWKAPLAMDKPTEPDVPPGYALVPVELTDAMADASGAEEAPGKCMFDVASQRWRDMLAAAPQFDAAKLKGGA